MKRFGDFGIKQEHKKIYEVPKITIDEILNCEIEVMSFESGIKTKFEGDRHVIHIKHKGEERKLFTTAAPLIKALNEIPADGFPFLATIIMQRFGAGSSNKTYLFT